MSISNTGHTPCTLLSARTRHADLRQKFTSDLQEKELIKIDFVRSEENTSDIMTKNVTTELFDKHTQGLVMDKIEMEKDVDKSSSRKGVEGILSDLSLSLLNKGPSHNNSMRQQPHHTMTFPDASGVS